MWRKYKNASNDEMWVFHFNYKVYFLSFRRFTSQFTLGIDSDKILNNNENILYYHFNFNFGLTISSTYWTKFVY